jgi:hypothetical protein
MEWIYVGMKLLLVMAAGLGTVFLCYRSVMDSRRPTRMLPYDDEPEVVNSPEATDSQQAEPTEEPANAGNPIRSRYWDQAHYDALSRAGTSFPSILSRQQALEQSFFEHPNRPAN